MDTCAWCANKSGFRIGGLCLSCHNAENPLEAFEAVIEGLQEVNKEMHAGALKMFRMFCKE